MIRRIVIAAVVIALGVAAGTAAIENKGAPEINLDGGDRGIVHFPHHKHQNALKDCQVCHDLFPQEKGSIARLKEEGKLVKKQIMNKHCIKCHKARKKEGAKSGPTTCSKCHIKS